MVTPVRTRKNRKKKTDTKPKKCYCGGKPTPKNKVEGTYAQCLRKGQVRLWGKNVVEKK